MRPSEADPLEDGVVPVLIIAPTLTHRTLAGEFIRSRGFTLPSLVHDSRGSISMHPSTGPSYLEVQRVSQSQHV